MTGKVLLLTSDVLKVAPMSSNCMVQTNNSHAQIRKRFELSQNVHPISLLSSTVELFDKVFLKTAQRHPEERNLLNAVWFLFTSRQDACMY